MIPTRAAGRPSCSMSATTRRVSARTSLGDPVPVLEVALEGLLAAVRPRHPRRRVDRAGVRRRGRAGGTTAPSSGRAPRRAPARRTRPAGRPCRCRAPPASCAVLRADPPQRRRSAGRPSPRTSSPSVSRQTPRGLPKSVAILARSLLSPMPTEQCSPVAASTRRGRARRAPPGRPGRRAPRPAARNASSQPSTSTHHRHAAPLQRAQRVHHRRRGLVVGLAVDRQEHRVRALARRHPQRHARADAVLAGLVRRRRHHAALGRVAAPPTTTGSPASSGRRSTSTAAMNWSRSTCSTHAARPLDSPRRGHRGGGGSASVDSIWSRPVSSSRSTTTERSWASTTSAASSSAALHQPGRLARPPAAPVARGDRHPVRRQLVGHHVGGVGQVEREQRVGAAARAAGGRPPPRSAGPAPGCCAGPGRAARPGRPSAACRPGAGPGTARTPPPPCPRRRRPAARGSGCRSTGRRPAAPAPRSTSPSTITSPAARSSAAILRITTAACSRGRRSGAAGTTVAATSATQPPISASVQRISASHRCRAAAC